MYCLSVKNSEENSRLFQAFKGAFIFQGIGDGNPVPPSRRLSDTTIAFSNFCSFSRSVFPFTSRSDFLSHSHLLLCLFVHFSLLFYRLIHFTPFASFGGGAIRIDTKRQNGARHSLAQTSGLHLRNNVVIDDATTFLRDAS